MIFPLDHHVCRFFPMSSMTTTQAYIIQPVQFCGKMSVSMSFWSYCAALLASFIKKRGKNTKIFCVLLSLETAAPQDGEMWWFCTITVCLQWQWFISVFVPHANTLQYPVFVRPLHDHNGTLEFRKECHHYGKERGFKRGVPNKTDRSLACMKGKYVTSQPSCNAFGHNLHQK